MTVSLIELNDRSIGLHGTDKGLIQSPGFANTAGKKPIFGEEAKQAARLHPRETYNQFWSQLSLDPLVNTSSHFRHQADLAFAHLNELTDNTSLEDHVVLAVPSNYDRNQLSILLGMIKSCNFNATGIVDMPLLKTAHVNNPQQTVYLDIQLHQSVVTTFSANDKNIQREKVVQIPGTGLVALHDAWANMITDEFIKQCRFDPQHNAETEQYIFNQLEKWLGQSLADNEVLMEINHKGNVYQARINRGNFEHRVKNIFARIQGEIQLLLGNQYSVCLPNDQHLLPGLSSYLTNISAVEDSLLLENCITHLPLIAGESDSLNFVTKLPQTQSSVASVNTHGPQSSEATSPTHILIDHQAYTLPTNSLVLGHVNGKVPDGAVIKPLDIQGGLVISKINDSYIAEPSASSPVYVNGIEYRDDITLNLGDVLGFSAKDTTFRLIRVE